MSILKILCIAALSTASIPGAAEAAAIIRTGTPCAQAPGGCVSFSPGSPPDVIQTFAFTAPSVGTAAVTINGTMQCVNNSSSAGSSFGVIDLSAQIVQNNIVLDATALGGQRFAMRIPPASTVGFSNAVDFTTTRVLTVKAGRLAFRYKMAINRMDPNTFCIVSNAYMSVVFVP